MTYRQWTDDIPTKLEEALDRGLKPSEAMRLLGYEKQESLASQLRRYGYPELARAFNRKDPDRMLLNRWDEDTPRAAQQMLQLHSPAEAAAKLGYKDPRSLARQLYRYGHNELANAYERVAKRPHQKDRLKAARQTFERAA